METSVLKIPEHLWQYILVANPDGDVRRKVLDIRRDFDMKYDHKHGEEIGPHILVANFLATESMEDTLIRWMQRIFSQYKGFPVTLNNYSGVPSHSVYLRVQDHEPFRQMALQLRVIDEYVRSNGCPSVRIVPRPYMAIATGLNGKVYDKAISDYSQKTFHESFNLSGLVLLKRRSQLILASRSTYSAFIHRILTHIARWLDNLNVKYYKDRI